MKLEEKLMNLFEVDDKYYLAHCISADYMLGAGIAVQFDKKYNMKIKIHNCVKAGRPIRIGEAYLIENVFNLVTKARYFNKPTYSNLEKSIVDMKNICIEQDIKYLAMPRIGCGLDGLSWRTVKELLINTFTDTDIEIVVCSL